MRRTTRGSLSFCAWRRSSSSFEMAVLFPFANVGRISPIITHCADYVELFMRTYIVVNDLTPVMTALLRESFDVVGIVSDGQAVLESPLKLLPHLFFLS